MHSLMTPLDTLAQWYDSLNIQDQENVVLHTFPVIVGWGQINTKYVSYIGTFSEALSSLKSADSQKVVPYLTAIASGIDLFFALKSWEYRNLVVQKKLSEAKALSKSADDIKHWEQELSVQPERIARMSGYAESWRLLREASLSTSNLAEWHRVLTRQKA